MLIEQVKNGTFSPLNNKQWSLVICFSFHLLIHPYFLPWSLFPYSSISIIRNNLFIRLFKIADSLNVPWLGFMVFNKVFLASFVNVVCGRKEYQGQLLIADTV